MNETRGFWWGFKDAWSFFTGEIRVPSRETLGAIAAIVLFMASIGVGLILVISFLMVVIELVEWLL